MDAPHFMMNDVPIGKVVRVRSLPDDGATRLRLLEIGVMPGAEIRLVRRAPLGCPFEIDVGGARFSIRTDVLSGIVVDRPE